MTITVETEDITNVEKISKLIKITNLELLFKVPISIRDDNFKFLKEMKYLKELSINPSYIEKDFFNDMCNLKKLELSSCYNLDYYSLYYLDSLKFNDGPYTISKYLSKEELLFLKENDVKISSSCYKENSFIEKMLYIYKKIDLIIEKLDLNSDISNEEKFKKLMIYLLDNSNETKIKEDTYNTILTQEGELYFALEDKYKRMSGYISLIEMIIKRINIMDIDYSGVYRIEKINKAIDDTQRYIIKINNRAWIIDNYKYDMISKLLNKNNTRIKEKNYRRIYELNNR